MKTPFSKIFPNIAHWVDNIGWIEIGPDDYSKSFVRLLDEGGMVWESENSLKSIDTALNVLEKKLDEILDEIG